MKRVLLVLLLSTAACRSSEEEQLRKQIDTLPTHLYVGLKVVAIDPARDPDVAHVGALIDELQKGRSENLTPAEAVTLARAAWSAKDIGAKEVRLWRDSKLGPLFLSGAENEVARKLDHALTLAGLTAFSIVPGSPSPAPESALLYEACMTGGGELGDPTLTALARSLHALTYARAGYCGIAATMTDELATIPLNVDGTELAAVGATVAGLGHFVAHAPSAAWVAPALILAQSLPWSSRLLAFGLTAHCLDAHGKHSEAAREWERLLAVAKAVGTPEAELEALRAVIASRGGDPEAAALVVKVAHGRLKRAGVYDSLGELPQVKNALEIVGALRTAATPSEGLLQAITSRVRALFSR